MRAAQIYKMAKLLYEHEVPSDKNLNFTEYTSGKVRIRFMDKDGNIINYMIEQDGEHNYNPPGVN